MNSTYHSRQLPKNAKDNGNSYIKSNKNSTSYEITKFMNKINKLSPMALLISRNALENDVKFKPKKNKYKLTREQAIKNIIKP